MNDDCRFNSVYAWLFIRGTDLDPSEVSALLKLESSYKYKREDRHGKNNEMIRKQGFWSITSEDKVQSTDLQEHIEWLLSQLEPVKNQLGFIVSKPDIFAQISCVFSLFTREWDDRLKPDILNRVAALNVSFGVSIYNLKDLDSKLS